MSFILYVGEYLGGTTLLDIVPESAIHEDFIKVKQFSENSAEDISVYLHMWGYHE